MRSISSCKSGAVKRKHRVGREEDAAHQCERQKEGGKNADGNQFLHGQAFFADCLHNKRSFAKMREGLTFGPSFVMLRLEHANLEQAYHTGAAQSSAGGAFCLIVEKNCLFVVRSAMKSDILTEYYRPLLERNSFLPIPCPDKFSPAGQCWEISPAVGGGYYWVYAKQELFDIKIHDFFFHADQCLDMAIPECISIQRYDSISGEELTPYRRLSAGDIQTIVGGKPRYRALIHKRIPVHSVGNEILPNYYDDFLKKRYPELYFDLPSAFQSVDQATNFPAMSKLLFEIENYRGEGAAAALFYEAKVTEAIALVVDAWKRQSQRRKRPPFCGGRGGPAKRDRLYCRSLRLRYSLGAPDGRRLYERKQAQGLL